MLYDLGGCTLGQPSRLRAYRATAIQPEAKHESEVRKHPLDRILTPTPDAPFTFFRLASTSESGRSRRLLQKPLAELKASAKISPIVHPNYLNLSRLPALEGRRFQPSHLFHNLESKRSRPKSMFAHLACSLQTQISLVLSLWLYFANGYASRAGITTS
jgi:hypothetical protein